MKIRINKKSLIHYLLIYFLIIVNQSCLYEYFLRRNRYRVGIFLIIGLMILKKYNKTYNKYVAMSVVLLFCTLITRRLAGGIGLISWIWWVIPIFLCAYVVNYDLDHFFERFIKISVFFAGIGMVFWVIQVISPDLLKKLLPIHYNTMFNDKIWSTAYSYRTVYDPGYGLFLYTFRMGDASSRNKGLFTEPGVCQMFYNSAIFVLLFFREKVNFPLKTYKRYLTVLVAAVITVQSTTGYLALAVLLAFYLFVTQKNDKRIKIFILTAIGLGGIALFADVAVRREESFISVAIVNKLFGSDNQFEVQASGAYRIGAAWLAIRTMINHPFGVGYEKFDLLMKADITAGGGAGFLKFGAMVGVVPLLLCILFYFVPIIRSKHQKLIKVALIFMIFNTLFAQSSPFYPMLILFPIYLMEEKRQKSLVTESL